MGEFLVPVDSFENGFEGVGGVKELRLPTGTRRMETGCPVVPRPRALRSEGSGSKVDVLSVAL